MRKFFYHFFCYLGLVIATIAQPAYGTENVIPLPFEEDIVQKLEQYKDKSIIETDNELLRLYVVYRLADKLFPEGKINDDMTVFLRKVFPKTDIKKLKTLAVALQTIIMVKRRYVYVIDRLKHKIKADSILPKDAPIIAKDGEYAPANQDLHKKSDMNSYQVSYTPHKYIEYDRGELGEPVRRRDKNYEPTDPSVLDEIQLALLEFDLRKFVLALKKLPKHNDGTREKTVELENGLKSRLLLNLSQPGDAENIYGVLEVYVPDGWYINGDYLNPVSKPKFYLTEDGKEDPNIKEYQVFYPTAAGVVSNGVNRRLWFNDVRFPLVFSRRDTNKGIRIKSDFTFMLCQAKTDECHMVTSHNSLNLAPSVDTNYSIHSNYINLSFAQVPQERTLNATFKSAYYDKQNKQLTVKFKAEKTFNNVAVMAEDAIGTNYTNPQYTINDDEVIATFDKLPSPADITPEEDQEIAITAQFDNHETMRMVTKPIILETDEKDTEPTEPNYKKAFLFGLLLNLMPCLLYLLQKLWQLFLSHPKYRLIYVRYTLSLALGIGIWGIYNHFNPWYSIIEHPALLATGLLIAVSYAVGLFGYMDFNLFRPLKKLFPRGILIAVISILIASIMPAPLRASVLDNISGLSIAESIKTYAMLWLGMITLPTIGFLWRENMSKPISLLKLLNLPYILIFIAGLLWYLYQINGIVALIISIIASGLIAVVWYTYPLAVTETTSHRRSFTNKTELFDKVQIHFTILIGIIWLLTCALLTWFAPTQADTLPHKQEFILKIQQTQDTSPTLLLIAQPQTYYNHKLLQTLKDAGIKIIHYQISGYDKNINEWLRAYHKKSPPLNILYNKRHKHGLSLPSSLKDLNWDETMAEFN